MHHTLVGAFLQEQTTVSLNHGRKSYSTATLKNIALSSQLPPLPRLRPVVAIRPNQACGGRRHALPRTPSTFFWIPPAHARGLTTTFARFDLVGVLTLNNTFLTSTSASSTSAPSAASTRAIGSGGGLTRTTSSSRVRDCTGGIRRGGGGQGFVACCCRYRRGGGRNRGLRRASRRRTRRRRR